MKGLRKKLSDIAALNETRRGPVDFDFAPRQGTQSLGTPASVSAPSPAVRPIIGPSAVVREAEEVAALATPRAARVWRDPRSETASTRYQIDTSPHVLGGARPASAPFLRSQPSVPYFHAEKSSTHASAARPSVPFHSTSARVSSPRVFAEEQPRAIYHPQVEYHDGCTESPPLSARSRTSRVSIHDTRQPVQPTQLEREGDFAHAVQLRSRARPTSAIVPSLRDSIVQPGQRVRPSSSLERPTSARLRSPPSARKKDPGFLRDYATGSTESEFVSRASSDYICCLIRLWCD